jgi:hypothetical protein
MVASCIDNHAFAAQSGVDRAYLGSTTSLAAGIRSFGYLGDMSRRRLTNVGGDERFDGLRPLASGRLGMIRSQLNLGVTLHQINLTDPILNG